MAFARSGRLATQFRRPVAATEAPIRPNGAQFWPLLKRLQEPQPRLPNDSWNEGVETPSSRQAVNSCELNTMVVSKEPALGELLTTSDRRLCLLAAVSIRARAQPRPSAKGPSKALGILVAKLFRDFVN